MKISIAGAGRRGFALAKHLEKHDIILIDTDEKKCIRAKDKLDCIVKQGNATDIKVLEQADIQGSDYFIGISDKDEINLISTAIAKAQFDVKKTIACVKNIAYTRQGGLKSNLFGIDYIVNPEEEAANNIINAIERGVYSNIITFKDSEIVLYNIEVDSKCILMGKTLIEMRKELKLSFIIACISREEKVFVPSGGSRILQGDIISIALNKSNAETILRVLGSKMPQPRRIIFQGLNNISDYILQNISPRIVKNILLLDSDEKICKEFADKYPNAWIMNADIMSDDVIDEENLSNYDLFVALEDSDEKNTITSLLAKKRGIYHSIALLKRDDNINLEELGIDLVVSTIESTVASLFNFLQKEEGVCSFHSIFGGQIEVDELRVEKDSKACGKRLKEIDIRNKGIVSGVKKENGESFLPNGDYSIESGDILLILITDGYQKEVREMFV